MYGVLIVVGFVNVVCWGVHVCACVCMAVKYNYVHCELCRNLIDSYVYLEILLRPRFLSIFKSIIILH